MASSNNALSNQTLIPGITISFNDVIGQQIGYIVFGFAGFVLSAIISVSLLLKEVKLRQGQSHILLTAMEIANCSLDFSYFLTGCFRLKYALTGEYRLLTSAWQCMSRIYTPLFVFTLQLVPMILLATACDRFIAVNFHIFYFHNVKTKHQSMATLFAVTYSCVATAIAFFCSWYLDQTPTWSYNCYTTNAVGSKYAIYYRSLVFSFTLMSGLVSLATIAALLKKQKVYDIAASNGVPGSYTLKQKALTKTLILTTLVVFLLMGFPATVDFFLSGLKLATPHWADLVGPYNNFIVISHSFLNDVILCQMNYQVRTSVKSFIRRATFGYVSFV